VGDLQRTIVAKLRLTSEGDAELFGKTAEEIAEMGEATTTANAAAENLGKTAERAFNGVASGSVRAANDVIKAKVALEAYRNGLEAAEKAGAHIGEGARAELERLEGKLNDATTAAGKLTTAQQLAQRATNDATQAAGGQVQQFHSLNDIIKDLGGSLGALVLRWGAAAGAVTVAHRALSEVEDQLKKVSIAAGGTGEAFEGLGQGVPPLFMLKRGLEDVARVIVDARGHIDEYTGALDEQIQAHEKARAAYLAVHDPIVKAAEAADKAAADFKKWTEGLGLSEPALRKAATQLADFVTKFAESNKQLSQQDLAKIFGPQIDALVAQFARLKVEVPPSLKAISDAWHEAGNAAKLSAEQQVTAASMIPEKLKAAKAAVQELVDVWRASGQQVPAVLAMQADAVGVFVGAIERVRPAVDLMTGGIEGGAAGLKAWNEELKRSVEAAEGAVAAARKLQQALEGTGKTAHLAAGEVQGVFLGTPQTSGKGFGYDPLGIYNEAPEPLVD